jgi:hypothetical protein
MNRRKFLGNTSFISVPLMLQGIPYLPVMDLASFSAGIGRAYICM